MLIEILYRVKPIIKAIVEYGVPTIAIILSIVSYIDSKKANKVQERLNTVEEKLKKYELEEREKEREEATKAIIEARIYKVSKDKYRMKIWNSGKATAYNVDFNVPEGWKGFIHRDKVPYEFLESGKSFEEYVIVCDGMLDKCMVTTNWTDKEGNIFSKEQIVSI